MKIIQLLIFILIMLRLLILVITSSFPDNSDNKYYDKYFEKAIQNNSSGNESNLEFICPFQLDSSKTKKQTSAVEGRFFLLLIAAVIYIAIELAKAAAQKKFDEEVAHLQKLIEEYNTNTSCSFFDGQFTHYNFPCVSNNIIEHVTTVQQVDSLSDIDEEVDLSDRVELRKHNQFYLKECSDLFPLMTNMTEIEKFQKDNNFPNTSYANRLFFSQEVRELIPTYNEIDKIFMDMLILMDDFANLIVSTKATESIFEQHLNQYLKTYNEDLNLLSSEIEMQPGQIPYQVAIVTQTLIACSGVILNDFTVLTTRTCAELNNTCDGIFISVAHNDDNIELIEIENIIFHNLPSVKILPDLAILKLKTQLTFGELIQPINTNIAADDNKPMGYYLAGFGKNGMIPGEAAFDALRRGIVIIAKDEDCSSVFPNARNYEICSTATPCYADIGSPLVYNNTLYGLLIDIDTCFLANVTSGSLFISTKNFITWIDTAKSNVYDLRVCSSNDIIVIVSMLILIYV